MDYLVSSRLDWQQKETYIRTVQDPLKVLIIINILYMKSDYQTLLIFYHDCHSSGKVMPLSSQPGRVLR